MKKIAENSTNPIVDAVKILNAANTNYTWSVKMYERNNDGIYLIQIQICGRLDGNTDYSIIRSMSNAEIELTEFNPMVLALNYMIDIINDDLELG